MKDVVLKISSIVGGGICVSADDGNKLHDAILAEINKGNRVVLSFSLITRMTTAFLNAAVGQLYGEFKEDKLKTHLAPPIEAEPWHLTRLKLVVDRAKEFFKDEKAVKSSFFKATGIDDE